MSCSASACCNLERLNCGLKRLNGVERTSTSSLIWCCCSNLKKCSMGWFEWPMVYSWRRFLALGSSDMRKALIAAILLIILAAAGYLYVNRTQDRKVQEVSLIDRGRYLVQVSGCNDCHTRGYAEKAGKIDEKDWLLGDVLGWQGPWGTTYP